MTDHLNQIKTWKRPKKRYKEGHKAIAGDRKRFPKYTEYCKKHKVTKENRLKNKDEFSYAMANFFRLVAENLIEAKGGVVLKRLGYFYIHRIPRKLKSKTITTEGLKTHYNHHTDHAVYAPVFLPKQTPHMKAWMMDGAFSMGLRQQLAEKLRSGYRYQSHVSTLKDMIDVKTRRVNR